MNHLVGCSLRAAAYAADPVESMLVEGERAELEKFKATYLANADASPSAVPQWELSRAEVEALPPSGWRALDDTTLLRFLRADKRKGEYDHATSMTRLLHALAWRKKMGSDLLLATPEDDAYAHLRIRRWVGYDKLGRPVQFERLGKFLSSGNSKAFTADEWLHHYARDLETTFVQLRAASTASGKPTTNYLFCADFAGGGGIVFHMGSIIPLLKMLTKEVEANFPEMVGNILIFNAPRIFATLFPMVKAFMDPITAAKIEVYASVPTERLLALMDASTLPTEYGGTNTAPYPQTRVYDKRQSQQDQGDGAVPVS